MEGRGISCTYQRSEPPFLTRLPALFDFSIGAVHDPAYNFEAPACLHSANDVISEGCHGRQQTASFGKWGELIKDQRDGRFAYQRRSE